MTEGATVLDAIDRKVFKARKTAPNSSIIWRTRAWRHLSFNGNSYVTLRRITPLLAWRM